MTTPVGLELVWAEAGGFTDPTDTKYQLGWIAEIPTFQNFNWVLQSLDRAKLAYAEADIYPWQEKIGYAVGARVTRAGQIWRCKQAHNSFDNIDPQDPSLDTTNSYWVNNEVISALANPHANLLQEEGLKLDQVNVRTGGANANLWQGNDATISNLTNILAMNTLSTGYENLLFGNVQGKLVVVQVGNDIVPDSRSLDPSANPDSFEIFHQGNPPSQTDVDGTIPENPQDGVLYGRRNNNWVKVTTTTVQIAPPPPVTGDGATWYNLDDGRLYVDINDGDSSQWVPASPPITPQLIASNVTYDNTASGLDATTVQEAIDEVLTKAGGTPTLNVKTGDYALEPREGVLFDVGGVTKTATLPNVVEAGYWVVIGDYNNTANVITPIVITSLNHKIHGGDDDVYIDSGNTVVVMSYIDAVVGWKVIDGIGEGVNSGEVKVTETGRTATTWYRKWSDGFIEQGGKTRTGSITQTVIFPVPYTDIDSLTLNATSSVDNHNVAIQSRTLTTLNVTGIDGASGNNATADSDWTASGY